MPRKTNFSINIDLSVLVSILIGIIVLLGVYIIVNQQKKVTFSDPVVSQEVIIPDYYVDNVRTEPIFLQQPTYFNPNLGNSYLRESGHTTNMYNIQTKEPFAVSDFVSGMFPTSQTNSSQMPSVQKTTSMMPSMAGSHNIPMNIQSPGTSSASNSMPIPMSSESDSVSLL
jgi:hypothetical protein